MSQFITTTEETWVTHEEEYTYGPDTGQMDQIAAGIDAHGQLMWGQLGEQYRGFSLGGPLHGGAMAHWNITNVDEEWGPNLSPPPNSQCPIPNDPVVTYEQKPHTFSTNPGLPYPRCTENLIAQPPVRTFTGKTQGAGGGTCNYRYGANVTKVFHLSMQPWIGSISCNGTTCTYTYPFWLGGGSQSWSQTQTFYVDFGVHAINTVRYTNKYTINHTSKGTCYWNRCNCSDFGLWNTQQACANATCGGVVYANHPHSSTPQEGAWSTNPAGELCMFTTPGPQGCCWTY